ncbi:hypothetical protein [Mahella sp.]|uniref:hypothetical protein n=1 Tax=Mahella sp. TaxID=2798721 RepID=UPI0025BE6EAA|nr:hypothetical protein [Mahella sp.]MBZ4666172.1 hypothetical protein [Mahella sp.]
MKRCNRLLRVSLVLVMVLALTFGMATTTFAKESQYRSDADTTIVATNTGTLFAIDEIGGISASSVDSLFGNNQKISRGVAPKLSNMTLAYENGKLVLHAILTCDSEVIDLVSSGDLYKNEKTDNAETYGNLILGDMSDSDNIHFVQLRIDKEKSLIMIILQAKDTKQLMQFQAPIDHDIFDTLYHAQENQLSGTALEEKIIDLYSVAGNLIDKDSTNMTEESGSMSPVVSTNDIRPMATYSGWTALINALNANGSVRLSNYSNIDASVFTSSGWRYDNTWGSTPYSFVSYGLPNGPGEYLIQFALVDIVTQSNSGGASDLWEIGMQARYKDGMLVSYDTYSDMLSVFYYGLGIRFDNYAIGINGLTNNAVFINRSVNRAYYEASGSIVRAAISVSRPLDTIANVFDYLFPYQDQNINSTQLFDQTYSQQYTRYNGKVIRGIAATTGSNILSRTGHFINVYGTIRYNTKPSWRYGYNYTAHHNL